MRGNSRQSRWLGVIGVGLATAVLLPVGGLVSTAAQAASQASPQASLHTFGPPVIPPAGQAYLGAMVNPTGATPVVPSELAGLSGLNSGLARNLSIVQIPEAWATRVFNQHLNAVLASGAIPMIDWSCGTSDAQVARGGANAIIDRFADQLAAWGAPVFVNWFPNPNSLNSPATQTCLGAGGSSGYAAAFRHIKRRFAAAGARNVAFVWSIDTSGRPDWASYYPGPGSVDWVAAEGYYNSVTPKPGMVTQLFNPWYSTVSSYGKPMMIADTATVAGGQGQYLQEVAAVLPTAFPAVRAFLWLDAPGAPAGPSYSLDTAGLQAFQALSSNPYFQPVRPTTSTEISVAPNPALVGQTVRLTATIRTADRGGTVGFRANGVPIANCGAVPLLGGAVCDTPALAAGADQVTAVYSGDAEEAGSTSVPVAVTVTPRRPGVRASGLPPAIPAPGHAYLGGWINPTPLQPGTAHMQAELQALPGFNAGLARPLAIAHVYQDWTNLTPNFQLRQLLADGATPMIDWRCGDTDANVIRGVDDALITGFAHQLAALGAPAFLRWYYEPNFPQSPIYAACIASLGPAGYAQAFQHIHDLFARAGATNVAFVWSMATSGRDQDLINYYPGSAYVDWIAADGYDRSRGTTPQPGLFAKKFGPWYSAFATFGKPMMVTETGALAGTQSSYLADAASALAATFPQIKGLLYFDAPADFGDYALSPAGLLAFQALSREPYFQPSRQPTSTAVKVSPNPARAGQQVRLSVTVVADQGGSVSLFANDVALASCASMAIADGISCSTNALPAGHVMIRAVYSGDAEYAGSASATLASIITPKPEPPPPTTGVPGATGGFAAAAIVGTVSIPPLVPVAPLLPLVALAPVKATPAPIAVDSSVVPASSARQESVGTSGPSDAAFQVATAGHLVRPFGTIWVLVCVAVVICLVGYIGSTWLMDYGPVRGRRRRS